MAHDTPPLRPLIGRFVEFGARKVSIMTMVKLSQLSVLALGINFGVVGGIKFTDGVKGGGIVGHQDLATVDVTGVSGGGVIGHEDLGGIHATEASKSETPAATVTSSLAEAETQHQRRQGLQEGADVGSRVSTLDFVRVASPVVTMWLQNGMQLHHNNDPDIQEVTEPSLEVSFDLIGDVRPSFRLLMSSEGQIDGDGLAGVWYRTDLPRDQPAEYWNLYITGTQGSEGGSAPVEAFFQKMDLEATNDLLEELESEDDGSSDEAASAESEDDSSSDEAAAGEPEKKNVRAVDRADGGDNDKKKGGWFSWGGQRKGKDAKSEKTQAPSEAPSAAPTEDQGCQTNVVVTGCTAMVGKAGEHGLSGAMSCKKRHVIDDKAKICIG